MPFGHPLLLAALLALQSPQQVVYNGREGQTDVPIPRMDGEVTVDGNLREPEWGRAAVLAGFSQFQPVDNRPATDSTEVLVWYSPTSIHFGIRAFEAHGLVHATLADRDRIFADDVVQILLGTFNDQRQAFVFAVNPLGVQADGVITETGSRGGSGGGGFNATINARESADLSANFVYESRGRVTDLGYEVEISIPFKSIRYQAADPQTWGINVVRTVQHLGHEDSWAPASRSAASFLAQSGHLQGLRDLRRGLVVDVTPSIVAKQNGSERPGGAWGYAPSGPAYGATVRWGITNNLSLNATVNPDFSQVEADVGAFQFDPRSAVFFAERRPFFLEGIENFSAPSNLIYSRRIVQPDAALKLTGKAAGTNIALLSALDDRSTSAFGKRPFYNVLRATRDLGGQSRLGVVYTDKRDGDYANQVAGIDARLVFGGLYTINLQSAASWTDNGSGERTNAPLWRSSFDRNGRRFGFTWTFNGLSDRFEAASGFISRAGIVDANFSQRMTLFGSSGAPLESYTLSVVPMFRWKYRDFQDGKSNIERKLHFNNSFAIRGGWRVGASLLVETFYYDPELYADYYVERHVGATVDTVAFTGTRGIDNLDWVLNIATPQWPRFSASLFYIVGRDENFFEWSPADVQYVTAVADWRPTDRLRVNGQYQLQRFDRRTDGSTVGQRRIPRLKVEYQVARSLFFRVVGQYDAAETDALRDDSRTNDPLLRRNADGTFTRLDATARNSLRADWLLSYQPTPGTVFFAGYGTTMLEDDPLRFNDLRRASDGFFVKLSYLFRL